MFSQFRLPWARTTRKEDSTAWLDDDSVAQSSLVILLVGLTLGACALVTMSSSAPSSAAKFGALWVFIPIGLGLVACGAVDLFYTWKGFARPWVDWRLRHKARRAHLCETKERCIRLMPPRETIDAIGHSDFVDVLMRMDSAS